MSDIIGQSLGRYHILEQLGEGGMATVYKAYDMRLERDVAIKIIRRAAFPAEQLERFLKRFDREAKALARLTHPNIVSVIDYGDFEGAPFLVMTYLSGGTLKPQMGKSMPWQEAVKLLLPIAGALNYAHSQNIIHRDIKPSNILLTQGGQPMLTDFGIAKIMESEETFTLTGTGVGVGTPGYMSPEQWIGQAGPQSDIYSLGVVLYELVTGRKPFTADTPAAIMLKQANDPLPHPRQFAPDLPEGVEKVLFKALAKRPEDRYQSMSNFAAALEQLTSGQSRLTGWKLKGKWKKEEEEMLLDEGRGKKEAEEAPKGPAPPDVGQGSSKWRRWAAIGGLVALVALGVVFGNKLLNRGQKSPGSLVGLTTHTVSSNMIPGRAEAPTPSPEPTPFSATPSQIMEIVDVVFDADHTEDGLHTRDGFDYDVEVVTVGENQVMAWRTGNGQIFSSPDDNLSKDYYMEFIIDNDALFQVPLYRMVYIEVEYFDEGTDTFRIQYDAHRGGPYGSGIFKDTDPFNKTDSGEFRTAVFKLPDAFFKHRDNGADFRIDDCGDGAETIRRVKVILFPP